MKLFLHFFNLALVTAIENSIVLKFGDNSVRIENEGVPGNGNTLDSTRSSTSTSSSDKTGCTYGQCLTADYDKMVLPVDGVNVIQTHFELRDIIDVNDEKFTITCSMYLGVRWREPRLINSNNGTQPVWLPLELEFAKKLWIPNIFIYDLKDFKVIHVLNKLAALYVVNEGELFYQLATHVTFLCRMRFEKFPVDEHVCKFRVGSSSYNNQQMEFQTSVLEYDASKQNTILDYQAQVSKLEEKDRTLFYGEMGNYSISGFRINLKRHMRKYIWNYHFPSGIFVMVSWVSFLIPPAVVPGRMGLLVTLFLVLANMFNSINSNSPTVEGMTSIGMWMISCILFVFGALSEYAVILFLRTRLEGKSRRGEDELDARTINMNKDRFEQWLVRVKEKFPKNDEEIGKLDRVFAVLFAVSFLVFNITFWNNMVRKE